MYIIDENSRPFDSVCSRVRCENKSRRITKHSVRYNLGLCAGSTVMISHSMGVFMEVVRRFGLDQGFCKVQIIGSAKLPY